MDQAEVRVQASLVLEAAAKIVTGSIEYGILGDVRTITAAIAAAEFLRKHAEFVRSGVDKGKPFTVDVEGGGC